ncbi:MAG: NAD(P)-binding domain-containing protein [Anaerolineales bacterium]|nr:MAG: NADP oxidoreductase [Chloroflexota bacterium]MBE7436227.1 NAD(P)-binding domain-containing protein [Anaerolineales bacterium]MCE7860139.1 NADP oxidoreductase [Chloroflexi bacterium CFX2]MCK6585067.1 NAD(P)-binding domain-containing protein [Anaerolineales bacterium]GJQ35797.1 MAG: NADP oxidoreductase [Anaerolineaceae bacterium]
MNIAVLGSGEVGRTIGSKLVQLGHDVMIGSREEANPRAVAWAKEEKHNALFGTFANAAEFGEIIFNCTLGSATLDALYLAGAKYLRGKILIDTSNPLDYSDEKHWKLIICNTDSLGEQIQRAFPETYVVKTLNTVYCTVMVDPDKLVERTDIFVSGNSADAKARVIKILHDWFHWKHIIDLGDITTSRAVEMYSLLWRSLRLSTGSHRFNIKVVST